MTSTASISPAFSRARHMPAETTPLDPPPSIASAIVAPSVLAPRRLPSAIPLEHQLDQRVPLARRRRQRCAAHCPSVPGPIGGRPPAWQGVRRLGGR